MSEEYIRSSLPIVEPINYYFGVHFFGLRENGTETEAVKLYQLRKMSLDPPIKSELGINPHFELSIAQFVELLKIRSRKKGIVPEGRWLTAYLKNKERRIIAVSTTFFNGGWVFSPERDENLFRWKHQRIAAR